MLCHQMSLTMKRRSSECRLFNYILVLSIIWIMLFTETMARPNIETLLSNKPNDLQQQQRQQQDLFLNEIITKTNGEKLFNKLRKYHHNHPNYLDKWPGQRDLALTLNYDNNNVLEDSSDFLNGKLSEGLWQLASLNSEFYGDEDDIYDDSFHSSNAIPMKSLKSSSALSANPLTFKDHNIKKNVQFRKHYMSPCHFKICNMGRKRNAHFFTNY